MNGKRVRSMLGIVVSTGIGALIALCGSYGSVNVQAIPVFAACAFVAFGIHWAAFVPSYIYRTEHYFDLTGSVTYLAVITCAVLGNPGRDLRTMVVAASVIIWAVRLGTFLFYRIKRVGKDDRFDRLKTDFLRFLMVWTLSGLWVLLTAAAAIGAITARTGKPWDLFASAGLVIWALGFGIEVVADHQKSRFRARSQNRDRFISSGLWAWSRHPNYFGEILLWTGVAVMAYPVLSGWQLVTLVSPIFVWLLLAKVSGIPLLEAKADEKWGQDPEYIRYRDATPVLFPLPPGSRLARRTR